MRALFRKVWDKRPWGTKSREIEDEVPPLREFIYLDEVSVYSLRASRRGAIESEQTDSETAEFRQTLDSEIGAATPVAKATVKSQFESMSSRGTQVARKWIIQSTFKELVDYEKPSMRIVSSEPPPVPTTSVAAKELLEFEEGQGVLPCSDLQRGDLLELEVELTPEDVFTASQLVKSMFTFFQKMPGLFRLDRETFEQGQQIDAMFDQLLVGLVPIHARVVGQQVVTIEGKQVLISDQLLEANPHLRALNPEPIFMVGVAERELFWRDLRRVLFSKSRFLVMCRLSGDGVTTKWNPIKMTNVFESVAPSLVKDIQELPKNFLGGFQGEIEGGEHPPVNTSSVALEFAKELADQSGVIWSEADSLEVDMNLSDPDDYKERRQLSDAIVRQLETHLDDKVDPLFVAQVRTEIFDRPQAEEISEKAESGSSSTDSDDYLLETEIVAIYW